MLSDGAIHKKTAFYGFAGIYLLGAIAAVYWQQAALLLVPFGIVGSVYLVQQPHLLFYILMAAIPWSIEYNVTSSLGTDLPDEPLMLLTALSAVLLWLSHYQRKLSVWHPILFLLGAQWIWAVLTIPFSTDWLISFKYILAKSWYLLAFVVMPLILFQRRTVLKKAVITLWMAMLLATVVALIRHATYGFTFEAINNALHPFFRNHVNYSALLVVMLPITIAAVQLTKKYKTLLVTLFVLILAAVYFSYARGAWLAAAMGLASYWLIRKKALVLSFILFICLAVGAALFLQNNDRYLSYAHNFRTTIFHTNFKQHLIATYELKDVSTAERFYRWIAGVRMVPDNWKTGVGPNTFYNNYRPYAIPLFKTWVSNNEEHSTVHNYFLLTLIEQGVLGLVLLLVVIGYAFYIAQKIYHHTTDPFWKSVAAAVGAVLWMTCIVNFLSDLVETDKVGSVFYIGLAMLVVADRQTAKRAGAVEL